MLPTVPIAASLLAIACRRERQAARCRAAAAATTDPAARAALEEAAIMLSLHGWTESAFADLFSPTPEAP